MNLSHFSLAKCLSKSLLLILNMFAIFLSSILEAKDSLPKQIGPTQRISPPVGFPDPVFENLNAVINAYYLPPANLPPSSQIFQYNSYVGALVTFNPVNDKIMFAAIGANQFYDFSFSTLFSPYGGQGFLAKSVDGGRTWDYGPPIEPIIPLGGTISQTVGLVPIYSKCGKLYAIGSSADLNPVPPLTQVTNRILFSYSNDQGKTWAPPSTLVQNPSFTFLDNLFFSASGITIDAESLLINPANPNLLNVSFGNVVPPSTIWGNVWALRSKNGGKKWSTPRPIYTMLNDPVWLAEHFDAEYNNSDGTLGLYLTYGGQVLSSQLTQVDKNTIVLPIFRLYPQKGVPFYTQSPANTNFDRGVVRSMDNGKTWNPIAGVADQYIFSFAHDPVAPFNPNIEVPIIVFDGALNQPTVVSPYTERIYMAYMAGNPSVSGDPSIVQGYPYILLTVSEDRGATWSTPVQINATPKNISIELQQAFNPNLAFTQDGSLIVGYYDFRNYTGGSDANTPLQTDAWLAVYKEIANPKGGSTGVGVDFIEEIRLTDTSFDGRIGLGVPNEFFPGPFSSYTSVSATGISFLVNNDNQLLAAYNVTTAGQNLISNISTGPQGIIVDKNNRFNVFMKRFQFPKPSNR